MNILSLGHQNSSRRGQLDAIYYDTNQFSLFMFI